MQPTKKAKRISRACDFCHTRGLKCKPFPSAANLPPVLGCLTCAEHNATCTYQRISKRRGTKPRAKEPKFSIVQGDQVRPWEEFQHPKTRLVTRAWIDIYLDSIHPVFPLYCEQELLNGWDRRTLPSSRSALVSLVSMCALSAVHAQKGALFNPELPQIKEAGSHATKYLNQAVNLIPTSLEECNDLDYLRAFSILALIGTQIRDSSLTHKFLGLYHALVARDALHNENRWPSSFTTCDKEVLRRIFWATYKLEVHHACVMGHLIRIAEGQCFVKYPSGFHHEQGIPGRTGNFEDWYPGWNFITDLYRMLEHAILDLRATRVSRPSALFRAPCSKPTLVIEQLSVMQSGLMPQFLQAAPRSPTDSGRNRCSFQTAKIISTIQLVRMATFASLSNLEEACKAAEEMIEDIKSIPNEYIRAFGIPLLHEVCGVGHFLGSLIPEECSGQTYEKLRQALSSVAELVENLDIQSDSLLLNANTLRKYFERIGHVHQATRGPANSAAEPREFSSLPASPRTKENDYGLMEGY